MNDTDGAHMRQSNSVLRSMQPRCAVEYISDAKTDSAIEDPARRGEEPHESERPASENHSSEDVAAQDSMNNAALQAPSDDLSNQNSMSSTKSRISINQDTEATATGDGGAQGSSTVTSQLGKASKAMLCDSLTKANKLKRTSQTIGIARSAQQGPRPGFCVFPRYVSAFTIRAHGCVYRRLWSFSVFTSLILIPGAIFLCA
jgi:hypothetical protein